MKKWMMILFIGLCLLGLGIIQQHINPYELQVDRWSAIDHFLQNLFQGVYPYSAQTHLGGYGSPFPVWQFFHIPFYFLGNVGLSILFAVVIFIHSISKLYDIRRATLAFILLLASPAFLYEVAVRSDLITNFMLVAAIICYLKNNQIWLDKNGNFIAVTGGLLLSTRLSACIPFIIYYFREYIHSRWRLKITIPIIAVVIFIITFLPFLLWDGEMLLFFEYNPFILQSRQGHISDLLIFIPLGIYLSLSWKGNFEEYTRNTAIILVLLVVVTFCHNMYLNNNWNALFQSAYDITYFNMSLPFLITTLLIDKKVTGQ